MAKVRDEEISIAVYRATKGLNDRQAQLLRTQSEKMWFNAYAKKSKKNMNTIIKNVRKRIKEGKYDPRNPDYNADGIQGVEIPKEFKMPKPKKKKKGKKVVKKKVVRKVEMPKKVSKRKEKEITKKLVKCAPSGRQYSRTEIHEGVGSKRAMQYREKHGIDVNDF